MEQEYTTIRLLKSDHARITALADRNHRNAGQEILVWLDAAEALMAGITPEIRDKIDTIENLRPAPEEGKGG